MISARPFELTDNDKSIYKKIDALIASIPEEMLAQSFADSYNPIYRNLYEVIVQSDIISLIKLAETYPKINSLCKLKIFDGYWANVLRLSGKNPRENAEINHGKIHEFLPQATIHSFDFVKGLYAYRRYQDHHENKDTQQLALEDLNIAAKYGNFRALNAKIKMLFEYLEKSKDVKVIGDIIDLSERVASLYLTAGYMLQTSTYLKLLDYINIISLANNNPEKIIFTASLKALIVAEKLEEVSRAMINNAFQGKTLAEASYNQFKNWFSAIDGVRTMASSWLDQDDINIIYAAASSEAAQIRRKFSLTASQDGYPEPPAPIPCLRRSAVGSSG